MRKRTTFAHLGLVALVLATGACMEDETGGSYASPARWAARKVLLPAGTALEVRLASRLHSQVAHPGDSWTGELVKAVLVDDRMLLPAGTWVHGTVVGARKPSSGDGAMIDLEIHAVTIDGKDVRLAASADEVVESPNALDFGAERSAVELGEPKGIQVAAAALAPADAEPLVLKPGTVMTFTIEESVAARYDR